MIVQFPYIPYCSWTDFLREKLPDRLYGLFRMQKVMFLHMNKDVGHSVMYAVDKGLSSKRGIALVVISSIE